jgi:hypothetical protein
MNAVKMLPGKDAVTQSADRRRGMNVFIPREMYRRTP